MDRRLPYVYVPGEYEKLERLVEDELDERNQSGFETKALVSRFESARAHRNKASLELILSDIESCSRSAGFPYVEPLALDSIKAERPDTVPEWEVTLSDEGLLDRIYGAWLGRCAGNMLGRPVENWSRAEIEERLKLSGDFPVSHYFAPIDPVPPEASPWLKEHLENQSKAHDLLGQIDGMVRDDDIDYTIIGLHILETFGIDFTTEQVGSAWLDLFPFKKVHTAERVAYINLVNNLKPPTCATHHNPYREWIGAQIRADMWGYVSPGKPQAAADLAYRDALLSHTANGAYGEMLVSAMISAALATDDVEAIAQAGLSVIPARSRLAEAVKNMLGWSREYSTWQEAWQKLNEAYGNYHPVHTINNAAVVLLALLFGKGDFQQSIAISVMAGFDTDCNGATVGSLLGIMLGAKALPAKWIEPLKDRVESFVAGYSGSRLSDLAARTARHVRL